MATNWEMKQRAGFISTLEGKAGWWERRWFSAHCVVKCGNVTSNLRCFLLKRQVNIMNHQSSAFTPTCLPIRWCVKYEPGDYFQNCFRHTAAQVGSGVHLKFSTLRPAPPEKRGCSCVKLCFHHQIKGKTASLCKHSENSFKPALCRKHWLDCLRKILFLRGIMRHWMGQFLLLKWLCFRVLLCQTYVWNEKRNSFSDS